MLSFKDVHHCIFSPFEFCLVKFVGTVTLAVDIKSVKIYFLKSAESNISFFKGVQCCKLHKTLSCDFKKLLVCSCFFMIL